MKRPVRTRRQAKPAPARHPPRARSARPERCPFHPTADHVSIHRKGPAMRFSTSPLSRGRQRPARPYRTHPRVERLEDRTVPVTALQSLAFDSVTGQLAIVGDARDNTVHSSSTAGGFVEVRIDDRVYSSDLASSAFAPALVGADNRTLGRLRL